MSWSPDPVLCRDLLQNTSPCFTSTRTLALARRYSPLRVHDKASISRDDRPGMCPGDEPRLTRNDDNMLTSAGRQPDAAAVTASRDCCRPEPRRLGAKLKVVQESLGAMGIPVTVLSMMPLRDLEACRERTTVALWTTWNDDEPHESCVYHPPDCMGSP